MRELNRACIRALSHNFRHGSFSYPLGPSLSASGPWQWYHLLLGIAGRLKVILLVSWSRALACGVCWGLDPMMLRIWPLFVELTGGLLLQREVQTPFSISARSGQGWFAVWGGGSVSFLPLWTLGSVPSWVTYLAALNLSLLVFKMRHIISTS